MNAEQLRDVLIKTFPSVTGSKTFTLKYQFWHTLGKGGWLCLWAWLESQSSLTPGRSMHLAGETKCALLGISDFLASALLRKTEILVTFVANNRKNKIFPLQLHLGGI